MKKNNYDYEEDLDILYVYNNPLKEKVIGNLVFGNIVVDVGGDGKVLGVEIDCASKLFNTSSENLKDLQIAEIRVVKLGDMVTFGIYLATKIQKYTFQFAIPNNTDRVPMIAC